PTRRARPRPPFVATSLAPARMPEGHDSDPPLRAAFRAAASSVEEFEQTRALARILPFDRLDSVEGLRGTVPESERAYVTGRGAFPGRSHRVARARESTRSRLARRATPAAPCRAARRPPVSHGYRTGFPHAKLRKELTDACPHPRTRSTHRIFPFSRRSERNRCEIRARFPRTSSGGSPSSSVTVA